MLEQAKTRVLITNCRMKASASLALIFLAAFSNIRLLAQAHSEDPGVTPSFAGKTVQPSEPITLRLSRPVRESEGKIAVFIGATDMTNLFSAAPDALSYTPRFPLPGGDTEVVVYFVSGQNVWNQIARFTLRVAPQRDAKRAASNGAGKINITPSLTMGLKSQPAESHFPESSPPQRERFADLTLQGSLRMEMPGAVVGSQMQFDIAGSSYRNEALRFAQEGNRAPGIDLSSYLMQFQAGRAKVQAGHIAFGANRHLINSFSSRGVSLTLPISSRADFSVAAMNGSSIIGWDNFIGLNRRKHQIIGGTLGIEIFPKTPGGLRFEGGVLHGSLLPIANFNQGNVTDAEQSKGVSFRVIAADSGQRVRLDAGFTRSRFNNPSDPLLNQSFSVVPVRETSRDAHYVDGTLNLIRNAPIGATRRANVTVNYRHETVDPLFRSVAAYTQADRFQNQIEVVAGIADVTATVSYHRNNDNLDDIPSILKTLTRRSGVIVGAPLVSLFGNPGQPSSWWPRVSYAYDCMHQFGAGLPINSGFASLSQVPDQISTNQSALADWQFQKVRFGYRLNRSFQDNQQLGRENADLRNLINGFTVGLTPNQAFDVNVDVNIESAKNFETLRIDHTNRIGPSINWRMTGRATLAATVSTIFAGDAADTSESRNAEVDLQWSYRFGLERSRYRRVQGQFFLRYANRYQRSFDSIFGFNNRTKLQTFNAGLSFTFF